MNNHTITQLGKLRDLHQHEFAIEGLETPLIGKAFLGDKLDLTSMEVSLNKDSPDTGINFFHSHKMNEEVYIFVGGSGEMVVDNERFAVEEGTAVKVPTGAKRAWWNTGKEDLCYIVIQAQANGLKQSKLKDAEVFDDKVPWV